ncbi:MAG TPA: CofH family radical SAM protein [Candidatus Thalassarchaeaceae archaeon]|nr:MAG TPA: CofH family radical SAM protein [Candidatus Poseidoniales archaeon]HII49484.1 CofH family radical SAM protein [Candidatus Thalassarchaeaceae archaeon]
MLGAKGHSDWRRRFPTVVEQLGGIDDILVIEAARNLEINGRVSNDLGIKLLLEADLTDLRLLGKSLKVARFEEEVYFNSNLHVNPTNICVLACRFCAFRRGRKAADAYALSVEEYLSRIRPFSSRIDEVHSVGGLHPDWTVEHYAELIHSAKKAHPHLSMKCLTAVEVKHLSSMSKMTFVEVLSTLKDAGLTSLPGGGAEILDDGIRNIICNGKESSEEYLDIHRTAHHLGLPTNCTMLFGTVERAEHRIRHLDRLRQLQDDTGGFQCFVPYPFLPDRSRLPQAQHSTGSETIRMIAISRIMLDNIPHIKAYRMNIGDKLAAIALNSGADDVDGTVGHEEIMHEAGSMTSVEDDLDRLSRLIEDAGGVPIRRSTIYNRFQRYIRRPPSDDDRWVALPIAEGV